jgi:NifU-like protein involved in Fe-S cluster formation
MMYPPQLLDHFQNPRNAGPMDSPDVSVQSENPACGDVMKLMLRFKEGRIADVRYQVRGCVAAIACGSVLTEYVMGKTPQEAGALRREFLVDAVGGLPNQSLHASYLAMDCLKLALSRSVK